ncbi:magnesium/cobalt transporter CorA [Flavobacterium gawalongense]|uniref:Magnesium transport protein CorA n=1 Tax=Flavobacterium gawalongense TaxID=2594432 RepID=A0A553BSR9_9FLAO|nr:magnesium/cobalt transporter CorA [Flavobacterium gawalongense]TRX11289.1 magnesium/cobalt transporter CorA [Flavobacterium gawalongense]TRX12250.1 magnesium/cobalt transporter CorA [Flavobacterium gawalongense]TRX30211.1 magnesium/cobalt transporter CorA [Flavobacterium gawalongense]
MRKIKYKKGRKLQPYNLEYTGIHKNKESEMQLFVYDNLDLIEYEDFKVSDLDKFINVQKTNWINIHGLNNVEWLKSIGAYFKIDNFMLADILNTTRRTKLEESQDSLFFNIKSLLPAGNSDNISVEQISFLIKDGILVSFQEKRSDFFTHIRERIRTHSGIVRTKKADYLLYILLDAIMENFYITIENEEDKVEELINLTKESADPLILERIEKHRDNFNFLKRSIIPLRDSLYDIKSIKDDNVFNAMEADNFSFFTRLHQKSLELLEQIESDMGSLESASNFFFSAQTHKMNEIMKTLTIVSAIFIPLTFIVGVYGMNFEYMPELKRHYGYHTVVGAMFLIVVGMIIYFKKRRWF